MSSIVYFLNNFNNYYNRIIKKYDSVSDYINEIGEENYAIRGEGTGIVQGNKGPVNFNINDGVNAVLTYNYDPNQDWQPNYILVCDLEHTIKSRWFVMEAKRTRQGQYKLNLHRDVIADNYEATIQSVALIENATLPRDSKYIFNSEGNTYNQIKKEIQIDDSGNPEYEHLLKDNSGCAWCVGYGTYSSEAAATQKDIKVTIPNAYDYSFNTMTEDEWKTAYGSSFVVTDLNNAGLMFYSKGQSTGAKMETWLNKNGENDVDIIWTLGWAYGTWKYTEKASSSTIRSGLKNWMDSTITKLKSYYNTYLTNLGYSIQSELTNNYINYNNKFIKLKDGIYSVTYKEVLHNGTETILSLFGTEANEDIKTSLDNTLSNSGYYAVAKDYANGGTLYSKLWYRTYEVVLTDVTNGEAVLSVKNEQTMLSDAPYYMFAIPYGKCRVQYYDSESKVTLDFITNPNLAINSATAFMAKSSAYKITDIQLVPYCPRPDLIKMGTDGIPIINLNAENVTTADFNIIASSPINENLCTVMLWCTASKGTLNIPYNIKVPDDATDFKVENETTFYRLNSPNYNGVYEFKPTMNEGVTQFNVDYWYKPGQPYIHINPVFDNMYGYDSNDARGLICQGDFSLPQNTNEWTEYIRNNVNYQNSFNRSIQNQETNRKLERINQVVGLASNTIAGGFNGAKSGAGGAVAGAVAGAVGSAADIALSEYSYKEQISYATDQFNYQLGNVKALAETITNVGSITPNNKIFPFLEKWSCTDEEKEALRAKLQYNGMSVGVISSIQNYLQEEETFIRAKLIRFSDTGDMHLVATIAEELHKGVYLKQ
jgi:hypothetical protein